MKFLNSMTFQVFHDLSESCGDVGLAALNSNIVLDQAGKFSHPISISAH